MATVMVGAAFAVVGKALAPLTDGLLKNWAASVELGSNVDALEHELKLVKALLEPTVGMEIDNSSLRGLLEELKELGYDADDLLDEMDYFRIQDELGGTFHAADEHPKGCTHNLALNVRHTAKAVGKQINCFRSCFSTSTTTPEAKSSRGVNGCKAKPTSRSRCNPIHAVGKCFLCSSLPSDPPDDDDDNDDDDEVDYDMYNSRQRILITNSDPPKLRFNRVDASKRMLDIVKKLRLLRQDVSSIIVTLGSNWSTVPNIAQSRPITTSESIEPKLYGRNLIMDSIIHGITESKHSAEVLTVIPIVGPGGIGKTTLAQHIYHSGAVQQHFDVKVWTCVSLNFNVSKLLTEIEKYIPKVDGESSNCTASELIRQRLKNKRLLLVLDDIWDCSGEDEWKQLLVPFQKSQVQGNIIIVTTRFPAQARRMVRKNDHSIYLQGLDSKPFEELFLEIIFGDDYQSRNDHKFLLETGIMIAGRLKGSPLAAKTVGRLLKTQLDLVHWTSILESKEWENCDGKNDIMPALKLSFDYLPSQLQQCFSYCGLFPQDYKFKREELIKFWIGLEVLHSSHAENKRVEDIGISHLTELVNYGFLEKKVNKDGQTCYVIHDLLHELAQKVSALECLSIDNSQSQVSSLKFLPSIRHLSINIDDIIVKDRFTLKNYVEDFNTLHTRLKVRKLQTLMIFGEHHGLFLEAFGDLLWEAKALRVIFLSKASYNVEYLLYNFYGLLHLRYLHIENSRQYPLIFPNIYRFYHMIVLDLVLEENMMVLDEADCYNIIELPRDMSNLLKLRHFLVGNEATHSSIVKVGKLKSLQELRSFVVKQEVQGFELRELGHLVDLSGSLKIYNLENVQVKEEVDEAKLLQKSRLHELTLHWGNIDRSTNDSTLEEHVLERLKPSSSLLNLSIQGHRGTTCPSWLGTNLSVKGLESLCLDGITWQKFPPIGELWLVDKPRGETFSGNIPKERFGNLRKLKLLKVTMVEKWVMHSPCQLFPFLEVLIIKDCPQLVELSFQHISCCRQDKEVNANLFTKLKKLEIRNCPKLLSFPPVPWTEAPCSTDIKGTGSSCLDNLVCEKDKSYEYSLTIVGKEDTADTADSMFWNVLAFHNLIGLKNLKCYDYKFPPLHYLQMLSSLRTLNVHCSSTSVPFVEVDSHVKYQFPVESLTIRTWNASGMELTQLLTYFPKLSDLDIQGSRKVTELAVNVKGQWATETPGTSSSSANIYKVELQQDAREKNDRIVASEEAERSLLLLPPQLQKLTIRGLRLRSISGLGGGLLGLSSLRRLKLWYCPFSSSVPFPNSLEHLEIEGKVGTGTPVPLSNLTSLTSLSISRCGDYSRGEGLLSLLAQGHLTKLTVKYTPNFFVDSEHSQVHEQEIASCSSKLQELEIDDVAGFTAASIHRSLLFSSLTRLCVSEDNEVKSFTEEQEALLFVNSLENITFESCDNLQSLPKRLRRLPNLKMLLILSCAEIQILSNDLPQSSLEALYIMGCPKIQSLPKDCLPDSLRILDICYCPAIRSLPNVDDLPRSLQKLDVSISDSEELSRQCSKLINIIPIVRT